ncbi:hypothetical protein E7Z59_07085 [Robertkochia marina]|uniref:Uncharacterized protein n=1 Tax=Robertkochia marina TaxID=1227945 RepID=A0A4S3M1J7_9FLAO|nr:hypothetical protein [Robertkochia marina]THD67419.1 hypothetical protein E7Z59_07085 [Robertkochia marina]TRZ40813.1 hypothetical protein D3A96_15235 [Robertkochia marina]
MSFGAGHVMDMINRMKQNRALKPSNRSKFKGDNRESIYSKKGKNFKIPKFKILPPKELEKVKTQIQQNAAKERKKQNFIYGIALTVITILILAFFKWLNK